jgi:hypothetical protein
MDTFHDVLDQFGRQILTVGALREMLNGVADDVHVVTDDTRGWYLNVSQVIAPGDDYDTNDFQCFTLVAGESYDARQS